MDSKDRLFLHTYDDILNKVKRRQEYDIIRASGLLRQLLIDSDPLIHQVNKKRRLKFKFEVLNHQKLKHCFPEEEPTGRLRLHWKNLDPSLALLPIRYEYISADNIDHFVENIDLYAHGDNPPVHIKIWYDEKTGRGVTENLSHNYLAFYFQENKTIPILKLKVDTFLTQNCLFIEGTIFKTVDIIKMAAHIKGGVHSGEAKTKEERHLLELDKVMEIAGLDASLMILVGLCNIVTNGLRPLYEVILKENK
jgi:hypothetical protein